MWILFQFTFVLGPGAYLLGRWQFFQKEPSRNALIGTLAWTYVMLFTQYNGRREIENDHKLACQQLEKFLVLRDPNAMEEPGSLDEWDACYRHTDEYIEAGADARADQAAN